MWLYIRLTEGPYKLNITETQAATETNPVPCTQYLFPNCVNWWFVYTEN